MTKKIFAMFLAVLMVVSMLPTSVFAAEATCPGKGEHTLENCSYTVVKVTEPTCGTMGFTTYKCDVCEETFSESWVDATGEHVWVDLPALAPTCAKPGYEAGKQCANCGKKVYGDVIPQLDEDATECEWVDLTPNIDCVTGGTKKFECASCGATWEFEVKPGEHNWNVAEPELITPATPDASGLAEVTCTICYAVKEVEVLYQHEHTHYAPEGYIYEHPYVAATCTTDGMKSYLQCRVCGAVNFKRVYSSSYSEWGWFQLTDAEWATLVIPASHTFDHEPTCVDTVLTCSVCYQNVAVSVPHEVDWDDYNWNGAGEFVPATCGTSGYMASWCKVCVKFRDVKILPALGHYEVTVNVPATCISNAYSYTYCTRVGCAGVQNPEALYPMTADAFVPTTAPVVGEGFYLGTYQQNQGTVLYFTGKMDGYYLATSHDVSQAVKVYLEIVHPLHQGVFGEEAYYLYFLNAEGEKVYIDIYVYDEDKGSVGVQLTNKPTNYYNWDNTYGVLTTTIDGTDYYLNTYNNYGTISASKIKYIATSFPAYLSEVGVKENVNVISYNVVKDSVNVNGHVMTKAVIVAPTCTETGLMQVRCALCGGAADTVEIPASHNFQPLTGTVTVGGKVIPAYVPASCEDGYSYMACTMCDEMKLVTLPGYGHVLGELVEETPNHVNPVVYDHQDCIYCGKVFNLTKKVWNDANKHWNTWTEANEAHGYSLSNSAIVVKSGNCAEYGLEMYTCADCGKAVYVKIAGTGEHVVPEGTEYYAPTCTEKGYIATYECARCKAIVGNAAKGELNELAALGHSLKENKNYKAADCAFPNYNAYTHYCERCDYKESDGTKLIHIEYFDHSNPCEATAFEYYSCHCGEEHMISFIVELGHEMIERPRYDADGKEIAGNFQSPTCYATGYTTFDCKYCGKVEVKVLATVEHTNAAGEKFTDKCTDTETDRHCVVCCKVLNHAAKGNAHDCTTADENKDGVLDCLGACVIGKVCHYTINTKMPSTCLQDAYTLKICGDCGKQVVVPDDTMHWNGHKPASNYEKYKEIVKEDGTTEVIELPVAEPMYLADYTYIENYVWYSVEVVDGEFVQNASEPYTAKFIEYVEPTYSADGYFKTYCDECKQVVTQVLPKKSGLGFELKVENANGADEFGFGSLIAVTVSANSLNTAIYGFDFDVDFLGDVAYVGYETMNENFILAVTDPEKVMEDDDMHWVNITGRAVNDVNGKMQNIAITENTELVKLYFRSVEVDASKITFQFDSAFAEAHTLKDGKLIAVSCGYDIETIKTRAFLDFNNDGADTVTDLYLAMTLLTGEHPQGKTYDVTMDINKDGEVTLEELNIAYNYKVGNYNVTDLFKMGISEEELELLNLEDVTICNNSACQKEIAADATYCPYCGNHQ